MKGAACYKLYDAAARCYDENTRVVCVCGGLLRQSPNTHNSALTPGAVVLQGKAKASAARAKVKRQFIARFARKSLRR